MATTFKTNRAKRQFVYRWDVPAKVLADQFDHLGDDESDGFFCYRGAWYHLSDFMRAPDGMFEDSAPFKPDGYLSDSAFSGVIISVANDGESYRVATFFS